MSDPISTSGITGSDGKTPIYEPNARWTTWSLKELYLGGIANKKYVPKVDDYVVDTETDERFIVTDIDPTTLIPSFKKIVSANVGGIFDDTDLLLGVGPGTQSDTYRVYIDKSKMPHTLAVDARLRFHGSMVTSVKIFKGSHLQGNEQVISAMYDAGGTLLGQAIPLELCAVPEDVTNHAIKSVPVAYTTEDLQDGEIVTVVAYSDTGGVVSKRQLLVENSAFIRSSNDAVKYVTGIELESPFLSQSDPLLIQYPINVPLAGMNLIGVVKYSDGSVNRLPVDQTKFEIMGFEGFVATIVGQKLPLVLKYNLSADEIAYGATITTERFFTKSYKAQTQARDGIYSVKLFGYPVWIDPINGYRLEWFLYNLDRDVYYKVTPYVQINENTRAFDPLAYGISQRLSVSVNLKNVNAAYKNYMHTQTIDIVLAQAGNVHDNTAWTVGFEPGQNPPYGRFNSAAMEFINVNLRNLDLSMGEATQEAWLNRVYGLTKPLIDLAVESLPLEPTHFVITAGGVDLEFPVASWNTVIPVSQPLANNDTLFIRFLRRTPGTDLQLAVAGVPIWQSN